MRVGQPGGLQNRHVLLLAGLHHPFALAVPFRDRHAAGARHLNGVQPHRLALLVVVGILRLDPQAAVFGMIEHDDAGAGEVDGGRLFGRVGLVGGGLLEGQIEVGRTLQAADGSIGEMRRDRRHLRADHDAKSPLKKGRAAAVGLGFLGGQRGPAPVDRSEAVASVGAGVEQMKQAGLDDRQMRVGGGQLLEALQAQVHALPVALLVSIVPVGSQVQVESAPAAALGDHR